MDAKKKAAVEAFLGEQISPGHPDGTWRNWFRRVMGELFSYRYWVNSSAGDQGTGVVFEDAVRRHGLTALDVVLYFVDDHEPPKRGPGRPRKHPIPVLDTSPITVTTDE